MIGVEDESQPLPYCLTLISDAFDVAGSDQGLFSGNEAMKPRAGVIFLVCVKSIRSFRRMIRSSLFEERAEWSDALSRVLDETESRRVEEPERETVDNGGERSWVVWGYGKETDAGIAEGFFQGGRVAI